VAEACFLGIDVSTTGSKALLLDGRGGVLAATTTPHTLQAPRPLWSEQDPSEWWQAVQVSVRRVLEKTGRAGESVRAVGLTGQMHGLVLLDNHGGVVRPAILWNDQRAQAECDEIHRRFGRKRFIEVTGNLALPGFTAPKILWVAKHEPEAFAHARHVLLPKDFIRYCLTGTLATDVADAAGTVLFDLRARKWSTEVVDALGIDPSWLPNSFEGTQVTGEVSPAAAEATGLKSGTPVVAGAGDQAAQAVGVGAVETGIVALTLGTSGVVFASTLAPIFDPDGRLHAFCHAVPGSWHLMGVMLSAAGSLRWYRDALAPDLSFDELTREAEGVQPGCEGLQFLPYLSGERTPYPDPLARAAWIGLTLRHGRAHMTRALLEGVAFGLKDCFALLVEAGLSVGRQVRVSGGGAQSGLWRQILASVLETELATVNTTQGAAFGAALLAGVCAGQWADVPTACRETVTITGTTRPKPEWINSYRAAYSGYRALYPALAPSNAQLARG
jgi:xylulokinase